MSNYPTFSDAPAAEQDQSDSFPRYSIRQQDSESNLSLPIFLTETSSKQTYYTIRFLVDHERILDAFRAYAYFRWVDDRLDKAVSARPERLAFLHRQQTLMDQTYKGETWSDSDATDEERMLVNLIRSDGEARSGLQSYIRNMMAVMAFDANRRGRLISSQELTQYSKHLAVGVTEALHYFIGHDDPSPHIPTRYLAVTGAHITHMLRDTYEDVAAGYFNVSHEFLDTHRLDPCDVESLSYKPWIKNRVHLARACFKAGKGYLAQVKNLRCQMAGYAYTARFEAVLNAIEREGYQLRPAYLERKSLSGGLRMGWSILSMLLKGSV